MSHSPSSATSTAVRLPRLYAVVDSSFFAEEGDQAARVAAFAAQLVAGGVALLQYRNKSGNTRQALRDARQLRRTLAGAARLIMNDRADLCLAAGLDGVHVGQEDLSVEGARAVIGNRLWVGVSTHSVEQVREADRSSADYIALGPVYPTTSKAAPDPVLGLEGVRAARAATRKPLVAIGGIQRENCAAVIAAGADAVAVISGLLREPQKSAEEFLRVLG